MKTKWLMSFSYLIFHRCCKQKNYACQNYMSFLTNGWFPFPFFVFFSLLFEDVIDTLGCSNTFVFFAYIFFIFFKAVGILFFKDLILLSFFKIHFSTFFVFWQKLSEISQTTTAGPQLKKYQYIPQGHRKPTNKIQEGYKQTNPLALGPCPFMRRAIFSLPSPLHFKFYIFFLYLTEPNISLKHMLLLLAISV